MKIHRVVQMLGATTSTGKLADDMYALGHKDYYSEAEDRYIPISHMDFQHMVRAFVKQNDEDVRTDTQEGKSAELVTQNQDLVNANKNLGNRIDVILKENEEVHLETHRLVQQLEHDEHQVGKIVPLVQENLSLSRQRDSWKEKAMNMMEKSSYDELTKVNAELKFQIEQVDRNQTVSKEAYDIAWDNNKLLKKELALMMLKYHELFDSRNTEVTEKVWQKKYDELNVKYIHDGVWKERYDAEVKNSEYWKAQYRIANDLLQPKGCGYMFSEIPNDTDGQEFVDTMKKYFNKKSYKMRVRGQHIKPELKGTGATYWGQSKDESTHMRIYIDAK